MNLHFKAVQRLVSRAEKEAKLNKTWQQIHDDTGIGVVIGDRISFTLEDRSLLREYIKRKTGLDPFGQGQQIPKRRVEAAFVTTDEKGFGVPVFSQLLRVARITSKPINTVHGEAVLPAGSFLSVPATSLNISDEVVVVVENGDLMCSLDRLGWPDSIQDALFVYRGHGQDASELISLIARSSPLKKVGFFDFDPAGLLLGIESTIGFDSLILPDLGEVFADMSSLQLINKTSAFWKQSEQLNQLIRKIPNTLSVPLLKIQENQLAIMQEHMCAHNLALQEWKL